ncbi:MAG: M23 family metallopeptidase [Actinomycetota bacterium]|nr:M23 family metallopeptidase [Actinomycetota bacterium]
MLISRVSASPARRSLAVGVAVAAAWFAVATGFTGPGSVGAAPSAVESVDGAASALAPAERLRPPWTANFPMQTTPRCDILDNFGDPRSGGRTHAGTDILATRGQEVYAMADGTLTYQAFAGGSGGASLSGNLWRLDATTGGTYYVYAHLDAFAPGLSVGSAVFAGQVIGWVGDTGNAGPGNYHLHFEIHPNGGGAVNPLPLLTVPPTCRVY